MGNEVHRREGAGLPRILLSLVSSRQGGGNFVPGPFAAELCMCSAAGKKLVGTLSAVAFFSSSILYHCCFSFVAGGGDGTGLLRYRELTS